jgi:hypothetical protein
MIRRLLVFMSSPAELACTSMACALQPHLHIVRTKLIVLAVPV